MVYTDVNYNEEFVSCLIRDVEKKLALVSNKDYKNIVYGLNLKSSIFQYKDLVMLVQPWRISSPVAIVPEFLFP